MKVYVIASQQNIPLAKYLLNNVKPTIVTSFGIKHTENELPSIVKRNMQLSDAILVLIDSEFRTTPSMLLELEHAFSCASNPKSNRNPVVIPIVLNSAPLPEEYENLLFFDCNTASPHSIKQIKSQIMSFLHPINTQDNTQYSNRSVSATSRRYILFATILELFSIISLIVLHRSIPHYPDYYQDKLWVLFYTTLIMSIIAAFVTFFVVYTDSLNRRQRERTQYEIESYSQRLHNAIYPTVSEQEMPNTSNEENKDIDALGRMLINLEDIKEYYSWSKTQSKGAFYFAVGICIAGLVLLTIAVILPLLTDSCLEASVISAIGGIVTELIAGTALVVYKTSLTQLNHYHQALHEDERFLSSVNLLNRFSTTEAQDEMLKELIRSEIQMNLNAAQTPIPENAKEK